jgi:ATP-dependent exoDNAse (exonuclease V) beta subunit
MARRLLAAAALSSSPLPEALPNAADALRGFVRARWAGARIHREIPVLASIQDAPRRQLRGSIDLLVEAPDGLIVIDHKTFPGQGESAWRAQAREHGPQVVAYLRALSTVPGARARGGWIHFAVTGALVEIRSMTLAPDPAGSTGGPDVAVQESAGRS